MKTITNLFLLFFGKSTPGVRALFATKYDSVTGSASASTNNVVAYTDTAAATITLHFDKNIFAA